jgi:hypothetical protein
MIPNGSLIKPFHLRFSSIITKYKTIITSFGSKLKSFGLVLDVMDVEQL